MSNQSATPPWLREEADDVQPLNNNGSNMQKQQQNTSGSTDERKTKVVYWLLKFVTMFLCVLIAATAVIGIGRILFTLIFLSGLILSKNSLH
jgi:hypothetical protein